MNNNFSIKIYLIIYFSLKINMDENNKTNWKYVVYPNLYEEDENKSVKDKNHQNFRI